MMLLSRDREESQTLLNAARKLIADLQDRASKGEKAMAELADMEERIRCRDWQINDLKAKVKVAETARMKFDKADGDNPPVPYTANVSKITKHGVIDYQRRKWLSVAREETAR
ncbi:unnamed protein product [Cuscuta europaea]|uniref:Uncharacterized protein n=1 Tax=Cuscuta europaea TaxID=41803 RepID=A0A9P1E2R6_CUSEU|nr:unnamed protein product [Cuscuta europaea]